MLCAYRKTLERYPYLVAVEAGKIRGYASAHRFQARAAYQWGAELSIYLEPEATSRGIGGRLYALLIALLAKQGIRTVYGCVTIPNPASERLHERLGFQLAGRFRRAGFKNGGWHDIAYYEKAIAPGDDHPAPPIPFPEIPSGEVRRLLAAYSAGSRP